MVSKTTDAAPGTDEPARWVELARPDRIPAAAVLLGGVLLHSMNVLLVATVLPSIVREVGGAAQISWPTTSFVAASIVAAACTGLVVATVGAKRAFVAGALIFAAGTLLCALAPSMALFIAGRFVQGFGGGLLSATAYVLVRNIFPANLWPRVFALLASVWSISVLLGPLLGGAFASYGSWRDAFYLLAATGCAIAVLALLAFPAVAAARDAPPRVPGRRIALICLAIAALSLAGVVAGPLGKVALLAIAAAAVTVMLRIDRAAASPMLPSDAFSPRTATGVGLWIGLLLLAAFIPVQIYVAAFLQTLHGFDPLGAGYVVASASLTWTLAAIAVAGLEAGWPGRMLVIGPLTMAAGLAATGAALHAGPVLLLTPAIATVGAGIGMSWAFTVQRIMAHARPGEEDVAAASAATVQQAGAAFGAAIAGIVANVSGFAGIEASTGTTHAAVAVPAAGVVIAVIAALLGARLRQLAA